MVYHGSYLLTIEIDGEISERVKDQRGFHIVFIDLEKRRIGRRGRSMEGFGEESSSDCLYLNNQGYV